uniref:hypothetical protein n=1 Tax=Trichocoleus desertorum TaxID=1481672 RepID=UPI0025B5C0D8|nr:hypothetical protein [Trichocoleus desertorum]
MSEEQPKSPSPVPTTPSQPTPPGPSGSGGTSLQQVTQTLQQKWEQVKPVLKTQSAKALRFTIRGLETAAEKLETDTPEQSTSGSATTQETSSRTGTKPAAQFNTSEILERSRPFLTKLQTWATTALEKIQPQLKRLQAWWTKTLPQIRNRLPASLNEKLSDRALTNLAIATVVFLVLTTNSVLSPSKPKAPEVAKVPLSQRVPPAELTAPPELSAPEAEIPVAIAPPEETTAPEAPAPVVVEPEPSAIAEAPEVPLELTAPEPPEPVEVTAPEPIEPPAPILSPQEQILASIQAKVSEVTSQYAENLVQSVKTNLVGNRLTVALSDRWYNLPTNQQDQLASEVLAKAKTLDFTKLEITDTEGKLIARTPVVGSGMVILQRGSLATAS